MAGGSSDDEKIASAQAVDPLREHPLASSVEPAQPATTPGGANSEWTVSDRRGPLSAAAAPDDDVERFVPGSETDAEGAHDSGEHGSFGSTTASPKLASQEMASQESSSHADSGLGESPMATTIDPEQTPIHASADHEGGLTGKEPAGAASSPNLSAAAAAPTAARRSAVPLVLSLLVGAAIGAGSAALVYSQLLKQSEPPGFAELTTRVDALEKRPDPAPPLATMKGQVDDLAAKVALLTSRIGSSTQSASPSAKATSAAAPAASATPNAAVPPAADTTALNAKIAALQTSVDALQKQSASHELSGKLETLQASLAGVQTLASTARTNVDALKSQQQAIDGRLGDLKSAVGDAQKQASAAKSGVDVLQNEQKNLAGKLGAPALAVVADSLVAQIASGKPYATQVDALGSLGADPVQVALLRQNASGGVPSSQALLAKFKPLEDPIVATGTTAPANANFGQRLLHGMFGLVSVRRTDVTTGNGLSSKVALIQADLANDDVVGAYNVWEALPAAAKRVSEAWGASAKTSVEAVTAARGLQAQSIGQLAAKKS